MYSVSNRNHLLVNIKSAKKDCGFFKPFLSSHVIAFLYLLMKAERSTEKGVFPKVALLLYSSVTMEVTLLGKGKYFPSPESQAFPSPCSALVLHVTLSVQKEEEVRCRGGTKHFGSPCHYVHCVQTFPLFLFWRWG